jgi:TolB-like protein
MALRDDGVPQGRRIEFRIGINLGDIIDADDIFADGVNVAARLEALAEPGGVCVSRVVRDQVRDKVEFGFEDLGEQQVKNIARPVRVYRIPLAETARTKGRAVDVKKVARELGVRYVLEGSVRKLGNRVRITGQLIDTASGAHIWADRFDGSLEDIFELQDEVASHVVGAIEPQLRQSEIKRATRKPTDNLDAYNLYLRAIEQLYKFSVEGSRSAIRLLRGALERGPAYAPAIAAISWCRIYQRALDWDPLSETDIDEAVQLARRAIEIGREDGDALWMAGRTIAYFAGDRATAASLIDRALALNPNSAHAWDARGWLRCYSGQPDLAIEAIQQAMRLSPRDPLTYLFKGRARLCSRCSRPIPRGD